MPSLIVQIMPSFHYAMLILILLQLFTIPTIIITTSNAFPVPSRITTTTTTTTTAISTIQKAVNDNGIVSSQLSSSVSSYHQQQRQQPLKQWGYRLQFRPSFVRQHLLSSSNDVDIDFEEEDDVIDDDDEDDDTVVNSIIENDDDDDDDDYEEEEDALDDDGIVEEEGDDVMAATTGRSRSVNDEAEYSNDDDDDDEEEDSTIDWDVNEDGVDYELVDEMDDPDYVQQKQMIDAAIRASEQRVQDETFDPMQFLTQNLTPEMASQLDSLPFFQQVEELAKDVTLTDDDVRDAGLTDDNLKDQVDQIADLMDDDPYPRHTDNATNYLEQTSGITDDDMIELDTTYKNVQSVLNKEPWDKVMLRAQQGLEHLDNQTIYEIDACLGEIGGSAYNVTNWLLYDLDFNVSNLILAAVQHNKQAPILFQHWYPQLVVYERYEHARDRNFDFTWDDVEAADLTELQRYYAGFGYDEIPQRAPAETGIINLDYLDEEDIKMAAFENWVTDVYNPEMDSKDFDDDAMRDEDNVFSDFYEYPQHPDLPSMDDAVDDIEQWRYENIGIDNAEKNTDVKEYRDMMGQTFDYEIKQDDEFIRDFRGHIIIACTGDDSDLEIAERITLRFQSEFGKQVYVETRVMALAREDDNVYEIWIESYDIELLHSKKRAMANVKGWTGPAEIDDTQIDALTNRVRFLISDNARYSYRYEIDLAD